MLIIFCAFLFLFLPHGQNSLWKTQKIPEKRETNVVFFYDSLMFLDDVKVKYRSLPLCAFLRLVINWAFGLISHQNYERHCVKRRVLQAFFGWRSTFKFNRIQFSDFHFIQI